MWVIDSDGPVSLELPVQWLWDIVDEFLFQYQVFCHYRAELTVRTDDEVERLRAAPQAWNVQTVMNILHSLADKARIIEQLRATREGQSAAAVAEAAGAYGILPLYRMLGYFSLVGLLRLHCLLGDYYLALRSVAALDLHPPTPGRGRGGGTPSQFKVCTCMYMCV
jgi:translation initiation factor 3 subunit L